MNASELTAREWCIAYEERGFGELKQVGKEWKGPCPICGGDDRFHIAPKPTGGVFAHCRHGCRFVDIKKALFPKEKDDFWEQIVRETKAEAADEPYGVTLADWAQKLRLPEEFLVSAGWEDTTQFANSELGAVKAVKIPYKNSSGVTTFTKFRVKLRGKDKYRSSTGGGAQVYGENLLDMARDGSLVLVEGETDAVTLWYHNIAALGVPGSTITGVLKAEHFSDIHTVYAVEEKDEAGKKFPQACEKRLRELGSQAALRVVRLPSKDVSELHASDVGAFKHRFAQACREARGTRPSRIPAKAFQTAKEIMQRRDYLPVRWVVKGLLPEGLALLAGGPKVGKSWLAYDFAAGVAMGRKVADLWLAEEGEVLYLDLEQVIGQKTQQRLSVVGGQSDQNRWFFVDEWPQLDRGGLQELDIWLEEHPACRLVVLDVISRIMPTQMRGNVYHAEYDLLASLKRVGDRRRTCILAIHHDNKTKSENAMDAISGSRAMTGACNSILWLQRPTGASRGQLSVTGRDVEEATLSGDLVGCRWSFEEG